MSHNGIIAMSHSTIQNTVKKRVNFLSSLLLLLCHIEKFKYWPFSHFRRNDSLPFVDKGIYGGFCSATYLVSLSFLRKPIYFYSFHPATRPVRTNRPVSQRLVSRFLTWLHSTVNILVSQDWFDLSNLAEYYFRHDILDILQRRNI